MSDRIDRDVINALIAGHFADPFSVLGMHKTTAGLEVRALLPDATDVWVIEPKTGRKLAKLECLDSRGFFSGVIPRRKNFFRYQLAVVWHGQQNLIDDPQILFSHDHLQNIFCAFPLFEYIPHKHIAHDSEVF